MNKSKEPNKCIGTIDAVVWLPGVSFDAGDDWDEVVKISNEVAQILGFDPSEGDNE